MATIVSFDRDKLLMLSQEIASLSSPDANHCEWKTAFACELVFGPEEADEVSCARFLLGCIDYKEVKCDE